MTRLDFAFYAALWTVIAGVWYAFSLPWSGFMWAALAALYMPRINRLFEHY
jgi:hypothetical protein